METESAHGLGANRRSARASAIHETDGTLGDLTRSTVRGADGYVRERAWQVIGIAAGVSLLVGYLLGRRG
jgi:ElaB/YqjD/DUF883 family membrane-anchored ribosome-binding protein